MWLFNSTNSTLISSTMHRYESPRLKSRGYSMVELMVGLLLSVFIVSITLTYTLTSSKTFAVQGGELRRQENARFAFKVLSQHIHGAGGEIDSQTLPPGSLVVTHGDCLAPETSAIVADACPNGASVPQLESSSGKLAIRFAGLTTQLACDGSPLSRYFSEDQFLIQAFWTADLDADGISSLYCQTLNNQTLEPLGRAVPIIDGIDMMHLQFALDADGDGAVDRYVASSSDSGFLEKLSESETIKAINLALLVNAGSGIQQEQNTEVKTRRSYALLNQPSKTYTDGIARQMFSTTIALANASGPRIYE